MGADPDAHGRDVAEQRVEPRAVLTGAQRVDPDQHAVHREEARTDRFLRLLGIEHGLGGDTQSLESGENQVKARRAGLRHADAGVPAPNQCHAPNR